MIPENLLYTRDHEWIRIEGPRAVMGITEHAQEQLGELTFVELPRIGQQVAQRGQLAVVESSKAASDVYAPLAGKVTRVNEELTSQPELINQDCYGRGWICELELVPGAPVSQLLKSAEYDQFIRNS